MIIIKQQKNSKKKYNYLIIKHFDFVLIYWILTTAIYGFYGQCTK